MRKEQIRYAPWITQVVVSRLQDKIHKTPSYFAIRTCALWPIFLSLPE
jgi:hypothetical protein